jgi:hypothetical protein
MESTHAAHSVFATPSALNVPAIASARPSSSLISPAPGSRPIVAYAHSVFATPCALNVSATPPPAPPAPSSAPLQAPAPSSHTPTACLPSPAP